MLTMSSVKSEAGLKSEADLNRERFIEEFLDEFFLGALTPNQCFPCKVEMSVSAPLQT
jgi:hypothetical protein